METKQGKQYTPEFKAQAVALMDAGKPVAQLTEELCVSTNLLRRENILLKKENLILKKPL